MKKSNGKNTSWAFQLDTIPTFAYKENAFSPEECEKIISLSKNYSFNKATVKNSKKFKGRQSKICWFEPDTDTEWIFRRITDIVVDLNNQYFKFDIFGLNEGIQFTKYIAPDGEYEKHIDRCTNFVVRKLSMSILLNNSNDYEGGDLKFFEDNTGSTAVKQQGTLILFPSYVLHQVTPVTKGERNSLVAWVTGNKFR